MCIVCTDEMPPRRVWHQHGVLGELGRRNLRTMVALHIPEAQVASYDAALQLEGFVMRRSVSLFGTGATRLSEFPTSEPSNNDAHIE